MRITVINGPNLNLLGTREPEVYGRDSLADLEQAWKSHGERRGIEVTTFQSNHEGALIDAIHAAAHDADGIVINPGAYAHTSYAIHDAIAALQVPAVEVHISDVKNREPWRATSVVAPAAESVIYGRGPRGYLNAIDHLWAMRAVPPTRMQYGSSPDHVVDVRDVPDTRGTVVLIHGGFWREKWTRDLMDPLAVALASEGWSTANIEYRRGHGSLPASREDVRDAISAIAASMAAPLIAVGHSAGGYLAIDAGSFDAVHGVIALAPIIDIDSLRANHPSGSQLAAAAGSSDDEWSLMPLAAPLSRTTIIHGEADDDIPMAHSDAFAESTDAALIRLDAVTHMDVIDPDSAAFAVIVDALRESSG